jgi:hypothetical protein
VERTQLLGQVIQHIADQLNVIGNRPSHDLWRVSGECATWRHTVIPTAVDWAPHARELSYGARFTSGPHPHISLNGASNDPQSRPSPIITCGCPRFWSLEKLRERVIHDRFLEVKPKWARFRQQPISFAFAWQKPS